ncbi:MAG TPA: zinc-ribbon domain-containing protein [Kofleriaceae bacterium]|nr:zinc-ribbon domain-containing protein [Kofleriaceae bacterium]
MDVRCEKCQTEYELDESRLKPGGVTVKCTNCGHMFKIRKRTPTNVGVNVERARTGGSKPPVVGGRAPTADPAPAAPPGRAKSLSDESATVRAATDLGSGPTAERQWLIRLENGEQKSCRELATLQQWIVAGIVTRESLISRSGKTWKRLGDIGELGQYFVIADEARTQRAVKPTPGAKSSPVSTLPGHKPAAAGGTVLPDDELEGRTTGNFAARRTGKTTPPPPPPKQSAANPLAQTELAAVSMAAPQPPRRPPTDPPPVPRAKPPSLPEGGRSTALWASSEVKASESMAAMPQGPQGGKLAAIPDEPAFAGRVRVAASDEASFDTGRVSRVDDDDDYLPVHRGSRAGLWITILSLLVIAGAAGVIYMFAFRQDTRSATPPTPRDAAAATVAPIASAKADAAVAPPAPDAPPPPSPLESARTELTGNVAARMKGSLEALASMDDPEAQIVRARLSVAVAQDELDRAGLVDKDTGDKLRKDARELVSQAAQLAQHAVKAKADDAAANLAMAEVMRLQSKPARDVHRYLDAARDKAGSDAELARATALASARLLERDKKLEDAAKVLDGLDHADVRVAIAAALIAYDQNRTDDAKKALDAVIAQAPDQETAQALAKKLETTVARTDPLPPEDHHGGSGSGGTATPTDSGGGGYDGLVAKANALAETNCAKAMELYQKALDIKAQGVEALTGMGYCHLDAKQFASAFSNFRSALMVSPRYEPALGGIAETYQRQGNRDQAIDSWRKYLEVFPGSPKAKKQLEILGATEDGGGGSAAPAPAPTPAPTPAPAPAPAPAAPAGSGSGSG